MTQCFLKVQKLSYTKILVFSNLTCAENLVLKLEHEGFFYSVRLIEVFVSSTVKNKQTNKKK